MKENFEVSLRMVLAHEGGWADDPQDPGGATMKGVTIGTFRAFKGPQATKAELRAISDADLRAIYRRQYWDAARGDDLPAGLDYFMFDYAVNSGPGQAVRHLQRVLGVQQDGIVGLKTLDVLRGRHTADVIDGLYAARMGMLRSLKTWPRFGKGWTARVEGARKTARLMAVGNLHPPVLKPAIVVSPRPDIADEKITAKPEAVEKITAGAGAAGVVLSQAVDSLTPFTELSDVVKWVCFALTAASVAILVWRLVRR